LGGSEIAAQPYIAVDAQSARLNATLDVTLVMRPKVLASLESPHGDYCVDIFAREDGSFGFEEYRRDPEDGQWRCLHRYSSHLFSSEQDAAAEAKVRVPWLASKDV
jgi:hypothetical protein